MKKTDYVYLQSNILLCFQIWEYSKSDMGHVHKTSLMLDTIFIIGTFL